MTPFDWGDYLQLAEALTAPDEGRLREASQRTSVSRAYFGMVHSASINFLTNRVSQKASFWSEIGKKLDFNSKTVLPRLVGEKGKRGESSYP